MASSKLLNSKKNKKGVTAMTMLVVTVVMACLVVIAIILILGQIRDATNTPLTSVENAGKSENPGGINKGTTNGAGGTNTCLADILDYLAENNLGGESA